MHNISFPNLGLELNLNPVAFSIGSLTIYWYGIITALAFLVIIVGILRNSHKYGLKQDDLIDLMLITTPIGIICARIFYVLVNWNYYRNNLSETYKIWHGGLAIYGGIVGGIITIYLFCRKRNISTLKLLDHIVVYLVLGQVIGRWGNFVNQELFGPNTNLPWAMTGDIIQRTIVESPAQFPGVDPNLPVHPLFLYESLWNLVAFVVLNWFRNRKKFEGEVFSIYMISYGFARFAIDSLRFDLRVGNVNVNRIIGLLFAVAFIIMFVFRRVRKKDNSMEQSEYEPSIYREILSEIEDEPSNTNDSLGTETTTLAEGFEDNDDNDQSEGDKSLDTQNGLSKQRPESEELREPEDSIEEHNFENPIGDVDTKNSEN